MRNPIDFRLPHRNTKHYELIIGGARFTISYETVVAVRGRINGEGVRGRLDNIWGRTTGMHMNDAEVQDYPILDAQKFNELCAELLVEGSRNFLLAKMGE